MSDNFDLERLIRPNIRTLKPYKSARDSYKEGLLLDANENSLGSPFPAEDQLHRYPSPDHPELRRRIAQWRGVKQQQVFTGVGSDESIDLLFRIFCTPGKDRILITPPTYGMYKVSASIHDVEVDSVLLEEDHFQPAVEKILRAVRPQTKLLFLCSPNNPTGNTFSRKAIRALVEQFKGIVVVDEAYVDFSDEESWAQQVSLYPNLVVLQTLSKSFGLAGIRLGVAIASSEIIDYFQRVKAPYNINKLTLKYAVQAFDQLETVQDRLKAIRNERERLRVRLLELSVVRHIYPSSANFLLVKVDGAQELYKKLADNGIILRYRGNEPHCTNCLRITIGTAKENDLLLKTIKEITHEDLD